MAYAKTRPDPGTATRRGRPARLSREQVVEAVTALLVADREAPLTIARAADAVGARPMSLYRHFTDRDDLVAAVTERVFADTRPPPRSDTPWQTQVRTWMTTVHTRAQAVPQLVHMLARGESAEWLASSAYLAAVFEAAGVEDDRLRAEAVYVVAMTTMAHAMVDSGASPLRSDLVAASLRRLAPDDADRIARLLPHYERIRAHAFADVVDRTLADVQRNLAPH